jgi:hypothetical protein
MSKKKIHILDFKDLNSWLYFYPIRRYKSALYEAGYSFEFFYEACEKAFDADFIVVNSKFAFIRLGINVEKRQRFLTKVKSKCEKLLWFDIRDSTTLQDPGILPFVDGYYKAQMLQDVTLYLNPFYSNRIFADYYHRRFRIIDSNPQKVPIFVASEKLLNKINVFWNFSLSGFFGIVPRVYHIMQRKLPLPFKIWIKFVPPDIKRPRELSCHMNTHTQYGRESVFYQRAKMGDILKQYFYLDTLPVSRFKYFAELKRTKIAPSPFGWGESSFRDFEVIASGAALLKPDMTHLKTWPPLYVKDETYICLGWDLSDCVEKINTSLQDRNYLDVSKNAQDLYHKYLITKHGQDAFVDRIQIIFS